MTYEAKFEKGDIARGGNMTSLIIDLFGGAGGFAAGAHQAAPGADIISVEIDQDACDTQDANGMQFINFDLSAPLSQGWLDQLTATDGRYHLHASPPCQSFSAAGKGEGRKHIDTLKRAIENIFIHGKASTNDDEAAALAEVPEGSLLTLVPAWWICMSEPDTISMEQVRAVLPLWDTYARCLEAQGYHAWSGLLHTEQYGVPQARQRAWLIAAKNPHPGIQIPPVPTHSKYHNRTPERIDEGVLPWVSMREVLSGGTEVDRYGESWVLNVNGMANAAKRSLDKPAATITTKVSCGVWEARGNSGTVEARVTVKEAATFQGFPEGFTFAGSMTSQFRQIGNAVNPPVARAIVEGLGYSTTKPRNAAM